MDQEIKQRHGFTGIWIPVEIWDHKDVCVLEKVLWSMIHSYSKSENGCFASNKYFAKEIGINEQTVQKYISNLKKLNLVEQVSFDGRIRRLKSTLKVGA
jgi:biotin operon repressor